MLPYFYSVRTLVLMRVSMSLTKDHILKSLLQLGMAIRLNYSQGNVKVIVWDFWKRSLN